MRFFFTLLVTLLVGISLAGIVAWVIRIWFPRAAIVVFVIVSVYWLYLGWRYASERDQDY